MSPKLPFILCLIFVLALLLTTVSISAFAEESKLKKSIVINRLITKRNLEKRLLEDQNRSNLKGLVTGNPRYKKNLNIEKLTQNQKILYQECRNAGITDNAQMANVFAQVELESGFVPKNEIRAGAWQGWLLNLQNRYWNTGYFGRGLIQLTWYGNYQKMGDLIGVDLVNNPNLANDITNASKIACIGMKNGSFTGIKLDDYINQDIISYYQARRIVNSLDKASQIHTRSMDWYNELIN
jgi:hypothetical protein